MWRLVKYLEENEQSIIDSAKSVQTELAGKLCEIWPSDIKPEKDCFELANAISSAMWLGRRAQQLKNVGDKSTDQFFREAIMQAFEVGKRSALTRS